MTQTIISLQEVIDAQAGEKKLRERILHLQEKIRTAHPTIDRNQDKISEFGRQSHVYSMLPQGDSRKKHLQEWLDEHLPAIEELRIQNRQIEQDSPSWFQELSPLLLQYLSAKWQAVECEIQFAAQGGTCLMRHPGFNTPLGAVRSFDHPLQLEDVEKEREALETNVVMRIERLNSVLDRLNVSFGESEKTTEALEDALAEHARLEKSLNHLRQRRQEAAAADEALGKLTEQIRMKTTEYESQKEEISLLGDRAAGEGRKREALSRARARAKDAIKAAQRLELELQMCAVASGYNKAALETAIRLNQLWELRDELKQKFGLASSQHIPHMHPRHCLDGLMEAALPKLRLSWLNGMTDAAYFFQQKRRAL